LNVSYQAAAGRHRRSAPSGCQSNWTRNVVVNYWAGRPATKPFVIPHLQLTIKSTNFVSHFEKTLSVVENLFNYIDHIS